MNSDEKVIEQIAKAAEVLGERKLRSELEIINDAYHRRRKQVFWIMGAAATLFLILTFSLNQSNHSTRTLQKMQIETSPTLLDSATYDIDSVYHKKKSQDLIE